MNIEKIVFGLIFLFLLGVFLPAFNEAISIALPQVDEPTGVVIQLFPFIMAILVLLWMARSDERIFAGE